MNNNGARLWGFQGCEPVKVFFSLVLKMQCYCGSCLCGSNAQQNLSHHLCIPGRRPGMSWSPGYFHAACPAWDSWSYLAAGGMSEQVPAGAFSRKKGAGMLRWVALRREGSMGMRLTSGL